MKRRLLIIIALLLSAFVVCAQTTEEKREKRKGLTVKEWNENQATKTRFLDHVTKYDANGFKIEEYLCDKGFDLVEDDFPYMQTWTKGNTRIVLESYIDGLYGYVHTEYIKEADIPAVKKAWDELGNAITINR